MARLRRQRSNPPSSGVVVSPVILMVRRSRPLLGCGWMVVLTRSAPPTPPLRLYLESVKAWIDSVPVDTHLVDEDLWGRFVAIEPRSRARRRNKKQKNKNKKKKNPQKTTKTFGNTNKCHQFCVALGDSNGACRIN